MVSLGGLDVAYGANTQLVRTNVLCIKSDANQDSEDHTLASVTALHNLCAQRFPAQLKPDYTWAFTANNTHFSSITTAQQTATQVGGILGADGVDSNAASHTENTGLGNSISSVCLTGERTRGSTANKARGMSIQAILNVGAVQIVAGNSTTDDLFTATSIEDGGTDNNFAITAAGGASVMQSNLMQHVIDADTSGEAIHPVVSTLSLLPVLDTLAFAGTVTDGELGSLVDASEAASTAGSTLAQIKTAIGGGAAIISVLSLCKVA